MPDAVALPLSLLLLAATLGAAVARRPWAPEWLVAAVSAGVLVAVGALPWAEAVDAVEDLAPTAGFLVALLVIGEGCRRAGLFDALGAALARGSRGEPRRLLSLVVVAAACVTAALSLDATVVLMTPLVFATALRLRTSPRPHVYACSHLANSASLLLPVSNLTNLVAFHAVDVSFARFAALMAAPWLAAVAIEWAAIRRLFRRDLARRGAGELMAQAPVARGTPRSVGIAAGVVGATLTGFAVSSLTGVDPLVFAVSGALALGGFVVAGTDEVSPAELVTAAQPTFAVFVLALGVVVASAAGSGLADAVDTVLPAGTSLAALLGVAAIAALLANLVNNIPATLLLVPVAATGGIGPVLATLIGVNAGPNLTPQGSLATLLWARLLHERDAAAPAGEFVRVGLRTVPPVLLASTGLLWLALKL